MPRRKPMQTAENATKNVGDHHIMPGLVDELVEAFDNPKKHLTTRGVAREKRVAETFVVSALFRDIRREVGELRGMVARRPAQSETVREFRVMRSGGAA